MDTVETVARQVLADLPEDAEILNSIQWIQNRYANLAAPLLWPSKRNSRSKSFTEISETCWSSKGSDQ